MSFTRDQKKEAFGKLPPEVRAFLFSDECAESINSIGKKYNLLIDKLGILEDEVFLVMYGLEKSSEFVDNIKTRLGISQETASAISEEVNRDIFLKIRDLLQNGTSVETEQPTVNEERDKVLDGIENPIPTRPTTSLTQAPERELAKRTTTDNFIGNKMSPDISSPQNNPSNSAPAKKYDADPYREPIQ